MTKKKGPPDDESLEKAILEELVREPLPPSWADETNPSINESANPFDVCARGQQVFIQELSIGPLSRNDALRLAAYLVCVAEGIYVSDDQPSFDDYMKRIRKGGPLR